MIPYPTNFPQPATDLAGEAETPTIRTDLDNGLIEQFGRFSTGRETFSARWELDAAELAVFEEWFNETLVGGVLIFGLLLPEDGAYELQPVRFVGGSYDVAHKEAAASWTVSARIERMIVAIAPSNRTLPIPQWLRLAVDPATSQNLTLAHRNALLTVRPDDGSLTTLRIYPPTDETQWIYFGISNQGEGDTLITSEDVTPIPPEPIPSWPALPNVNRAFRLAAARKAARIDMESGHSRQYAALDATLKSHDVEFDFTLAQLQTFQDFFYTTLKSGSLPFWLTLPVDNQFAPVRVRIIGGKYSESYIFHDTFRVTFRLDRLVDQTVLPSEERPFPEYYGPRVNVTANRKMWDAQGKFFIVNPDAGQTISLHIYDTNPEFGLLIIGPGNVLITRGPFIMDLGTLGDTGASAFGKPSFELRDTIRDIGSIPNDTGASSYLAPILELISVVNDIGALPEDDGASTYLAPVFELIDVLVDLETIAPDTGASAFGKPSFELVIP